MVIVALVDDTKGDEAVLQKASSLARVYDEPIHAVYVMTPDEFVETEKKSIKQTGKPVERESINEHIRQMVEGISSDLDVTTEPIGLVGDIANNVTRYATNVDARFIVIGLKKRSPAGKALFGSARQSILLNAEQPVVSIRINPIE